MKPLRIMIRLTVPKINCNTEIGPGNLWRCKCSVFIGFLDGISRTFTRKLPYKTFATKSFFFYYYFWKKKRDMKVFCTKRISSFTSPARTRWGVNGEHFWRSDCFVSEYSSRSLVIMERDWNVKGNVGNCERTEEKKNEIETFMLRNCDNFREMSLPSIGRKKQSKRVLKSCLDHAVGFQWKYIISDKN